MKHNDEFEFRFEDEQHFSLLSAIKEYLRAGDVEKVDEMFSSTDYHFDIERIFFNDAALAIASFEYMWAQSCYIAIEEGVDAAEAGHVYEHHRRKLLVTPTVLAALEENKQFHHALTLLVRAAKEDAAYSPVVRECRDYIKDHILEPPTVQSVAEALGISRGHLSTLFKAETGQTVQAFIRALRLAEILELLDDPSVNPADVWAMTGFCSQSHYIQFFKSMTGKTPKAFLTESKEQKARSLTSSRSTPMFDLRPAEDHDATLQQLDDYADSGGFKQQLYQLYLVRKGRVEDLERDMTTPAFQKKMRDIFQGNRTMALETLLYLLPQISSAAIDGGVSMRQASRLYIDAIQKTHTASCEELLQLLPQAHLDYAKLVAETQKTH